MYVIDIAKYRRWTYFFEVFRKEYLVHLFACRRSGHHPHARIHVGNKNLYAWIFANLFQSWIEPYLASFLFSICYMLICWSVAFLLDRKKIYIKL